VSKRAEAERAFNMSFVREAVKRMTPELVLASNAVHNIKRAEAEGDDDYHDFDQTVELGFLVDRACGLCAAHLSLLYEIACVLDHLYEDGLPEECDKPVAMPAN
jgi:hypothetical protein